MATQTELLAHLDQLLSQQTGGYFTPTMAAYYLNRFYAHVQQCICEIAPEEFLAGATAHIVNDQNLYARPSYENVRRYDFKDTVSGRYREMRRIQTEDGLPGTFESLTDGELRFDRAYSVIGKLIWIQPTPTGGTDNLAAAVPPGVGTGIAHGLRIIYREVVKLTQPADVPRIPDSLHHLLPFGAAIMAVEASKDAGDSVVDRWRQRVNVVFGQTPESRANLARYYKIHQARELVGLALR